MKKYFLKKLFLSIITLFLIVLILFLLMDIMPGSPFNNEKLTPEQMEMMKKMYGLDKPVLQRFFIYAANILKGDFGISYSLSINTPVSVMIASRMPVSMLIGLCAMLLGSALGLILGFFAAFSIFYGSRRSGRIADLLCMLISIIGISVPSYIFAIIMSYFLGYRWRVFPLLFDFRSPVRSSVMAVIALSTFVTAVVARYTRDEATKVLKSDYVLFAISQGIQKKALLFHYVIRNSLMGIITVMAMLLVGLLTGSLVTERIFSIPGIGFLLSSAIEANDYNVIIALSFVFAAIYVTARFILDILYGIIDPRVRIEEGRER